MKRLLKFTFSIVALAVLLAGCDSIALWKQTNDDYAKSSKTVKDKNVEVETPPPAVTSKNEPYVDTHPISLNHEPGWYTAPVTINASGLPFSFYVTQLLGSTPVQVHMDPGINPSHPVNLRYTGTVKGALEELAAKSGYYYDYDLDKNTINWSALQTKVFDISFIPGVSKYSVGPSNGVSIAGGSSSGSSGSSSSSSSSSSTSSSGIDITSTGEYSNIGNDNLSVWDDMKNTIMTLLSPKGKLSVSQSTTTITVRDHPSNISDVGYYLDKMNKILSQQVHFDVQVLDVQLNKDFSYGINWNDIAYKFSHNGGQVSFAGNYATASAGILTAPPTSAGTYTPGSQGKWSGNIMIQALEEQGKVSIVTQPSLTTLNDQVAQIAIQTQQSYLASQSTTMGGSDSSLSQETLTPGTVTYGFQMYLLPKIQEDKVYLQISSVLSDLTSLQAVTQTGQVDPDGSSKASAIQVPNLAQKNFNQRTLLRNGQTLVLAGFRNLKSNNQKDTVAGLTPLGGMAAQSNNEELVVLITPTILNGDNF